jgi:hypothetical protein
VNTQEHLAAKRWAQRGRLLQPRSTSRSPSTPYADNRALGGFILIDRERNATVAAGTLDFALRRAGNVHWHRGRGQGRARADQGPAAEGAVVHRPVRRRQVHRRQPGGKALLRAAATPSCSTATTCATA